MATALPETECPDSDFSDDDQSPIDSAFNKASNHVRTITSKLNSNQLLELYGLYKQGTEGRCSTLRPGWLNVQGRQKWDAWNALKELPQEEAKQKYATLVQKFDPDWTELSSQTKGGPKEQWVAVSTHRYSPEPELDSNDMSILEAARENCADRITELLGKYPELKHEKDEDGLSALHWAADRDAIDALSAAIRGGCPVDATDSCGQTPLHYAASCSNIESVKILLNAGASPLLKDEEESTPIDLAADIQIRKLMESASNNDV